MTLGEAWGARQVEERITVVMCILEARWGVMAQNLYEGCLYERADIDKEAVNGISHSLSNISWQAKPNQT